MLVFLLACQGLSQATAVGGGPFEMRWVDDDGELEPLDLVVDIGHPPENAWSWRPPTNPPCEEGGGELLHTMDHPSPWDRVQGQRTGHTTFELSVSGSDDVDCAYLALYAIFGDTGEVDYLRLDLSSKRGAFAIDQEYRGTHHGDSGEEDWDPLDPDRVAIDSTYGHTGAVTLPTRGFLYGPADPAELSGELELAWEMPVASIDRR